jgi:hypothetical protein
MPSKRRSQRQRRQRRSVRGGDDSGAAASGIKAFGDMGEQVRGDDGSIQLRQGGNPIPMQTKGGSRQKKGGKSVLMDVAVPAVLLYANNNIYKNKTSKDSKKSRKFSRSTRRYRK